ncbi:hypothetical protein C0992_007547 [Termitomyces sp. T32_za158]|nr:hypothetical protein C0992_007547 [Termitomyces sp. T32_za158]
MSGRPATPPIIAEPTDIDDVDLDWYYDEHAGGYVLSFGEHAGKKIHETSITYLYWCNRTLDRNVRGLSTIPLRDYLLRKPSTSSDTILPSVPFKRSTPVLRDIWPQITVNSNFRLDSIEV